MVHVPSTTPTTSSTPAILRNFLLIAIRLSPVGHMIIVGAILMCVGPGRCSGERND
jgi:hypothetical protein